MNYFWRLAQLKASRKIFAIVLAVACAAQAAFPFVQTAQAQADEGQPLVAIDQTLFPLQVIKSWQDSEGNTTEKPELDGFQISVTAGETTINCSYQNPEDTNLTCSGVLSIPSGQLLQVVETGVPAGWSPFAGVGDSVLPNCSVEICTLGVINKHDQVVPEQPSALTIKAAKVVCDEEVDLPNWSNASDITATTAADFVASHSDVCHLANDWKFQYGFYDKEGSEGVDMTTGDHVGPASIAGDSTGLCPTPWCGANVTTGSNYDQWHNFDSATSTSGGYNMAEAAVTDLQGAPALWVREELQKGYVPYADPKADQTLGSDNVSAEIYCNNDVLNYDNYDLISNPTLGNTYYCVAFNAYKEKPKVHLSAQKIVCPTEGDLPNMSNGANITATTADEFLATHPQCHLESNWKFQWGFYEKEGQAGVHMTTGDHVGPASIAGDSTGLCNPAYCGSNVTTGAGYDQWHNFDTTTGVGTPATADIADLQGAPAIWVREELKAGYIPYADPKADQTLGSNNNSAEIYCNTDVLNYDNYDLISNPIIGETYNCVAFNVKKAVVLKAYKIICDNESDLPNWGTGGANITATTATDYLETHPTCHPKNDWQFQWGYADKDGQEGVDLLKGDHVGPASAAGDSSAFPCAPSCGPNTTTGSGYDQWHTFDTATADGGNTAAVAAISDLQGSNRLWVREILQSGYVPFSAPDQGMNPGPDVSAEIYCNDDVLNYDNFDYIFEPQIEQTYYCVAFNALKPNNDGGGSGDRFTLTVHITSTNEGSGTVTDGDEDPNIDCHGLPQTGTCVFVYPAGTSVDLTATPDAGSSFTDTWFGDCSGNNPLCNLVMNSNKDVTAHFSKPTSGGGGGYPTPYATPSAGGGGGGAPGLPQVLGDSTTTPSNPQPEVGGVSTTELPRTGLPLAFMLIPAMLGLPFLKKRSK